MAATSIPEYRGEFTFGARFDGNGSVSWYKGQLRSNSRVVTIEVIAPPFDAGLASRLIAEANLTQENIWPVLGLFRVEDQIFVVREPLEGALTLTEFVRQKSPDLGARVRIMIQGAKALAFAHTNWVIHGDLTASRIWVLPDGSARVADFSLERSAAAADALENIRDFAEIFRDLIADQGPSVFADLTDGFAHCQTFDEIVRQAEAALRQHESFIALVDRGRAWMDAGQFKEAIQAFESAARLGPLDTALLDQALRGLRGEGPKPADRYDENVQFTVYRPELIRPGEWKTLLAFAHLSENPPDAPAGSPDPLQEVRRRAGQMLGADADQYQDLRQDASSPIPAEGELTFVPEMSGIEFNPPRVSFLWQESVHQAAFRLRATPQADGSMARGQMCVYLGSIVVAQIPLRIEVNSARSPRAEAPMVPASAARYRKIFASYSHRDVAVVQEFERYGRAMGDEYLRDVVDLRSGEVWNDRLLQMIDQADVFQLFWSRNSMGSQYVQREWQYALSLNRECFVRPVFWEEPMPETAGLPPEDLRALHFHRVFPGVEPAPISSGMYAIPKTVMVAPPAPAPAPVTPPYAAPPPGAYPEPRPAPARKPRTAVYSWAAAAAMLVVVAGVGMLTVHRPEPATTAQNQPPPMPMPTPAPSPDPPAQTAPVPSTPVKPPRKRPAPPEPVAASPPEIEPAASPPQTRPTTGNYRLMVWSRGSAIREGQILVGGDPQLQCFVIGAADSRSLIQVRWFFNGVLADTMSFQGADVAKAYRRAPSPGQYRAVLVVDGDEISSLDFTVQTRATPLN